jgi:glycosyltransferase involved in cell wall biosynthesis
VLRVLYVQYTSPGAYPPLVRGARLLADAGARVLMLGTRVNGLDALDAPTSHGVEIRLMPAAADGWRLKAHYARYAAWVAREGSAWKPDWVYASDLLSAPIALGLSALTGARVVYHEHDAPTHEHPSWTIRQCLAARSKLLRQADLVVTPNAERSAIVSEAAGGRAVMTVWNCPLRPIGRRPATRQSSRLEVMYRGSINGERLPATVVDAIARTDADAALSIAGYETAGSRGYVASLEARARELGVSDRVRALGTVTESELGALVPHADLGLALMPVGSLDENMRHMTGASNKVFEYLSAGVCPLVSDLPDWRATFVDAGCALACDPRDPASIASTFAWAASHRDEVSAAARRGYDRLERDWNYETQFAPVLHAMFGDSVALVSDAAVREEARCAS